ncbi:thiamine phosphate synthase [Nocardioides acrostichi]|uniref:Thiamine phosphate synthase n=1 Tax=Nocardioides acrostichi TaxID=2784339 RepID=A0A930V1B9_9ACTN|nr:thiamine phosphate synthase [Nocardioides acrostichi]MBF4163587.1 thiamine phosphate synthase [Nocardioides acrostichi]
MSTSWSPPRLLLLTDRAQLRLGRGLLSTLAECVDAGLEAVVVRELDLELRAWSALVEGAAALPGLRVVTARRTHPAAVGIHLAEQQPKPCGDAVWGRSCHGVETLREAADAGADWAMLSPFATSASKPGHLPVLPASAWSAAPLPTFALGGVDGDNAAAAIRAGAHGVAVMGAVMRSADPAGEVSRLLAAVRSAA